MALTSPSSSQSSPMPAMTDLPMALLAGTVVALGLSSYAGYFNSPQAHAVRHLPTPCKNRLWLITLRMMTTHGTRIYDWLLDNCIKYDGKPWRMQLLGRPVTVIISSPRLVEDILKTQFDNFVKGKYTSYGLHDVLGDGIFAADGALWSHQRKTASHLFSLARMRDTMESAVRSHCAVLCGTLDTVACATTTSSVEIKRLLDLFTMDVFTKIGFGVDVGGLKGNSSSTDGGNPAFLEAFSRTSVALLYRFQQPQWLWELKKWLRIGVEGQLHRDMDVINTTVHGIIQQCMDDHQRNAEARATVDTEGDVHAKSHRSSNLIALFLDKPLTTGDAVDVDVDVDVATLVRDMSINFIAAGRDTTSQSMAWFLLMMNRYPTVLANVRAEIQHKLPHVSTTTTSIPTMADVQDLPYLEAAIKETMRLNPVVAVTSRTAVHDTTLSDGTFLKAGTRVVFSNYAMARLPSVWGDNATQFDPSRWLDPQHPTHKLIPISPFQFPVFLGGPRACLGMKFAMMEMKITLVALLSRFDLRAERDPFAYTYRAALTMSIRGPV